MSYTNDTLTSNEKVGYFGSIHWAIYIGTIIWFIIGLMASISGGGFTVIPIFTIIVFLFLKAFLTQRTSEFAITTKRVIMKTGLIKRRSVEYMLAKVETINVNQSLFGRLFNYGTVFVCGTGGSKDGFKRVSDPLKFQRKFQQAVELSSN
jgi:uncharacterized membrane protein YdbT with pleckstrin-like domain